MYSCKNTDRAASPIVGAFFYEGHYNDGYIVPDYTFGPMNSTTVEREFGYGQISPWGGDVSVPLMVGAMLISGLEVDESSGRLKLSDRIKAKKKALKRQDIESVGSRREAIKAQRKVISAKEASRQLKRKLEGSFIFGRNGKLLVGEGEEAFGWSVRADSALEKKRLQKLSKRIAASFGTHYRMDEDPSESGYVWVYFTSNPMEKISFAVDSDDLDSITFTTAIQDYSAGNVIGSLWSVTAGAVVKGVVGNLFDRISEGKPDRQRKKITRALQRVKRLQDKAEDPLSREEILQLLDLGSDGGEYEDYDASYGVGRIRRRGRRRSSRSPEALPTVVRTPSSSIRPSSILTPSSSALQGPVYRSARTGFGPRRPPIRGGRGGQQSRLPPRIGPSNSSSIYGPPVAYVEPTIVRPNVTVVEIEDPDADLDIPYPDEVDPYALTNQDWDNWRAQQPQTVINDPLKRRWTPQGR